MIILSTVRDVNVPRDVTLPCAAVERVPARVPPVTVPVVVIDEDPVSIVPNPEVIDPEFNAPVVTIFEPPTV